MITYLGDGTGSVNIDVAYWSGFPRNKNGECAFCNSNSDEWNDLNTPIGQYFARNKWADTCPMCNGQPS